MQSKKKSLQETLFNTFTGMIGSFLITMFTLQFVTGQVAIAVITTVLCTVWSIVRGYSVRRYFNKQQEKQNVAK